MEKYKIGEIKMNKGVIYKIARSAQDETASKETDTQKKKSKKIVTKFFIKLDNYNKINDHILNLYFNEKKLVVENIQKDIVILDAVSLFSVEKAFMSDIDLTAYLGKKLEFVLDITNSKITSIEETAIGEK